MFTIEDFGKRLNQLRLSKNVSARDMSLSIGQCSSYIFNIETGHNLPSMTAFFSICEYLEISPAEFFQIDEFDGIFPREGRKAATVCAVFRFDEHGVDRADFGRKELEGNCIRI